ncbi:hypothetical protein SDC9_110543 [bioreactor metagenome]|uniref:Uncharacterized protein n=1 Tax=bioreactor metagenome TaxID=1076179 RepID=A0A645BE95_9ZZZZ
MFDTSLPQMCLFRKIACGHVLNQDKMLVRVKIIKGVAELVYEIKCSLGVGIKRRDHQENVSFPGIVLAVVLFCNLALAVACLIDNSECQCYGKCFEQEVFHWLRYLAHKFTKKITLIGIGSFFFEIERYQGDSSKK